MKQSARRALRKSSSKRFCKKLEKIIEKKLFQGFFVSNCHVIFKFNKKPEFDEMFFELLLKEQKLKYILSFINCSTLFKRLMYDLFRWYNTEEYIGKHNMDKIEIIHFQ